MSTPVRAWHLNHALCDAQKVCALTKVGTILKELNYSLCLFQVKELREQLHKRRMKTSQASERWATNFHQIYLNPCSQYTSLWSNGDRGIFWAFGIRTFLNNTSRVSSSRFGLGWTCTQPRRSRSTPRFGLSLFTKCPSAFLIGEQGWHSGESASPSTNVALVWIILDPAS